MLEEYTMEETKQQEGRSPDSLIQAIDRIERLEKQLKIAKKYLSLIKRNVSVGSLAYTYVANAQTEIKEVEKWFQIC